VAGNPSEVLRLPLNAAGLADLNAATARGDDWFSVGGTLYPGLPPSVPDDPYCSTMTSTACSAESARRFTMPNGATVTRRPSSGAIAGTADTICLDIVESA
jgi:hypothetical protein